MDTLSHALYGATLCSRTGFAGGRTGPVDAHGRRLEFDWTRWAAFAFGLLPDAGSLGAYFAGQLLRGESPSFAGIPPAVFVRYDWLHSLIVALGVSLLLRGLWKPLWIPSLAWSVHIVCDVFTHGEGRFQTLFLYPVSSFTFGGLNWWMHPGLVYGYWVLLPVLWLALHVWRRRARLGNSAVR